jgi:hypothetical protein
MELVLLGLRNDQPADFAGAVCSIIFAFLHYHLRLKYDGLIDLQLSFQLLHQVIMELWRTIENFND